VRVLIFAAAVLLATGLHARAQTPQTSQWVLTLRMPSAIWTPGVYTSGERCEAARKRAIRTLRGFVCVELLSP
jgi:hypothetical protein